MQKVSFLLQVLVALAAVAIAVGKNRDQPHPHTGIIPPFEPGPFDLELDKNDLSDLASGKPVMKQSQPKPGDTAGSAICVQDVDAPKEAVWSQILDLDAYKGKVPKVNESKIYSVKKHDDGTTTIKAKMSIGVIPGYSFTSYYDHKLHPDKGSLVWKLDYEKTSDFDDVSGHWHVEDHPEKPGCSRLFYACDIKLAGVVPTPVVNFVGKSALRQATSWVKKNSEVTPEAKIPAKFDAPAFVQ